MPTAGRTGKAREWVRAEFAALGLSETTDSAGNDTWVYLGTESGLAPIALGSHTDTVPNGGRYDGALGVLSALAAVRALYQENRRLRHPVEVINFAAEEATMSGATFGSRAMAGTLAPDVVNHRAWDSRTVADHLRDAGLDPHRVTEARRTDGPAAFLELHIEQGRRLETQRKPIGVVEGIAGIRRYEVTVNGYANHAGTTLMQDRQDALVMAAPIFSSQGGGRTAWHRRHRGENGHPAGLSKCHPGQVIINLEIRGLDEGVLDLAERQLEEEAGKLQAAFVQTSYKPPVDSDPLLVQALVAACEDNGYAYARMASGAGHDAMCMADLAPQAMLFVPSRNGVSHSPDEYTPPEDCVAGAQVLGTALLHPGRNAGFRPLKFFQGGPWYGRRF